MKTDASPGFALPANQSSKSKTINCARQGSSSNRASNARAATASRMRTLSRRFLLHAVFDLGAPIDTMKDFLLAAAAVLFFGCTDYIERFAQYEGQQQNWPVAAGATVDRSEVIPVYFGPPPRPYLVMGKLAATSGEGSSSTLKAAVKSAQARGADAVILLGAESKTTGYFSTENAYATGGYGYAFGSGSSVTVPLEQTGIVLELIKWK
jgi:hypothetical protein